MTTATRRQRHDGRLGRVASLGLLALAAVLCHAGEARAQWTTSGTNISNTNTGNVGVGTSNPTAKLEVVGPLTGYGPAIRAGGGGDVVLASGGSLFFDGNYSYASGSFIRPLAANTQGFFTSGAERLRIDASGNIGVGTNAPGARFHVVGANAALGAAAPLAFSVVGGAGSSTQTAGYAGGGLSFQGGAGGWNTTGSSFYYSGNGGAIDLRGGNGGKHLFGVSNAGTGGAINITGGTGGEHNVAGYAGGVGGSVVLNGGVGGTGTKTGPAGNVLLANERGNVGVGTSTPGSLLEVRRNQATGTEVRVSNSDTAGFAGVYLNSGFSQSAGGFLQWNNVTGSNNLFVATGGNFPLHLGTNNAVRMTVLPTSGNVGVGTAAPEARLHVAGDIRVDGNINAKYQDVAEWVPTTQKLQAGTVVVLDRRNSNHVLASHTAYDTRVAGVISARPGLSLGEGGEGKVLVATTGRVKVKVDATRAPIEIGDLIVTSDVEGVAMKSEPISFGGRQIHAPGTIIGKALEPLAKGTGEILVLLSLQ